MQSVNISLVLILQTYKSTDKYELKTRIEKNKELLKEVKFKKKRNDEKS